MIKAPYIEFSQPIGTFYLSKLNASDLLDYNTPQLLDQSLVVLS